jgi:hypothetical protein
LSAFQKLANSLYQKNKKRHEDIKEEEDSEEIEYNKIFGWMDMMHYIAKNLNLKIEDVEQMNVLEFYNWFNCLNQKQKLENKKLMKNGI